MDVAPLSRRGTDLGGFSELYDIELAATDPGT
jgi:hypothetical protein